MPIICLLLACFIWYKFSKYSNKKFDEDYDKYDYMLNGTYVMKIPKDPNRKPMPSAPDPSIRRSKIIRT